MADARFNLDKFIIGKDKSFIQAHIKQLKDKATKVYIVTPGTVGRLDLISYALYGTTELKWVLIYVNDIIDISVIKYGYKMKYVAMEEITKLLFETTEQL